MSDRIDKLLAEMTLEEKVSLLAGEDWWHTPPIDRLGVPRLKVSDGPAGVRGAHVSGGPASASFPCGTALGATWDTELLREIGVALAGELRSKGATVILAPTVNLHRTPLAGRNFECYSEDPFLTARLSAAYIDGVQSQGMATTVKHFAANDSEFERMTISSEVPERALRELYLVPFESAIDAGTHAVMTAYNKVYGTWCGENALLMETIARGEWGYDGMFMSDWYGTHTTAEAAAAGLDLEMPGPPQHRGELLVKAVAAGELGEDVVTERARRVLQLMERTGVLDGEGPSAETYDDNAATNALLRRAAGRAIVLLRNERAVLPLDAASLTKVALVGPLAATASTQGGGSAGVMPPYEVSPLQGLRAALGDVEIVTARGATLGRGASHIDANQWTVGDGEHGLRVTYFAGVDASGTPVLEQTVPRSAFRWSRQFEPAGAGATWSAHIEGTFTAEFDGPHTFSARTVDRCRLWVGDAVFVDEWDTPGDRRTISGTADLSAGESVSVRLDYASIFEEHMFGSLLDFRVLEPVPEDLLTPAVNAARDADVAIVVVGMDSIWESEGHDRANIDLPPGQDDLIRAVAAANANTIVVVNAGAPIAMPWRDEVAGIVQLWYLGQEAGNALADVLTGAVDAAGRLPTTFAHRLEDIPAMLNYPGENGEVLYGEGLFIGYRAFDKTKVEPLYPFGFGLSYTTFSFGEPSLSAATTGPGKGLTVTVPVTNTGERAGDCVVQLYVRDAESSFIRPEKELKGFARIHLAAGASGNVDIALDDRAFQFWDSTAHAWRAEPGEFELLVGASAGEIRRHVRVVWEA
jgi:beta-glucosidase